MTTAKQAAREQFENYWPTRQRFSSKKNVAFAAWCAALDSAGVRELVEALERYGQHEIIDGVKCCASFDGKPCDCGFESALAHAKEGL